MMNKATHREVGDFLLGLETLSERYREDEGFRSRMTSGDAAGTLSEFGLDLPPRTEVRVVENASESFHLVLPPDPNTALSDDRLEAVVGGTGTVQASSLSSFISTASTMRAPD